MIHNQGVTINYKSCLVLVSYPSSQTSISNGYRYNLDKSKKRAQYMRFTVPIYTEPMFLAYSIDRFDTFEWQQWADLKPYRLQITRGYEYGDDWNNAVTKHDLNVSVITSDTQSLKMLLMGRVDLVPIFYLYGTEMLKNYPDHKKIRFTKKAIHNNAFYFGISKKSFLVSRLDEINKALLEMQHDGTFKRILKELYIE